MKKFLAVLFAVTLIIAMLPIGMASAEEDAPEEPVITEPAPEDPEPDPADPADPEDPEDPEDPGLLPDSPFYFFKRFIENIRVWFTFNADRKTALLSELADNRAAELEALEKKFAETEMTDKQREILKKAAEDLETAAEGLFDFLLGEGEDLENLELTEEGLTYLETALVNLGLALDNILEAEDPEDVEEPEDPAEDDEDNEDEDEDEDEGQGHLTKREKYERRIQHLEQIRDRNPESCHKGLNRAIENARRQQKRWEEKHNEENPDAAENEDKPKGSKNHGKGNNKDKGKKNNKPGKNN